MTTLRPYQMKGKKEVYQKIRDGFKRIVFCLPTGGGKTTWAGDVIRQCAEAQKSVLVMMHSRDLVKQFHQRLFDQFNLSSGMIMGGTKRTGYPVQIGTVQTLKNRVLPKADIVFTDEGHRARATTYQKILDAYPDQIHIALTATPFRGDGKNLGTLFETIVQPVTVSELIEQGHLVGTEVYRPVKGKRVNLDGVRTRAGEYVAQDLYERYHDVALYAGVVENYRKHASGMKAICFNVNREHSLNQTKKMIKSGLRAVHVDSQDAYLPINGKYEKVKSTDRLRDEILRDFRKGKYMILNNVALFTEGLDVPDTECIILNRAIKSLNYYVQAVGRGLRPASGKPHCIVLDHGENTILHGFVDYYDDVPFVLKGTEVERQKSKRAITKECPKCDRMVPMPTKVCPDCGYIYSEEEETALMFSEFDDFERLDKETDIFYRVANWRFSELETMPLKYFRLYGILKGYNHRWAYHYLTNADKIPTIQPYDDDTMAYQKFKTYMELVEQQTGVDKLLPAARKWKKKAQKINGEIKLI